MPCLRNVLQGLLHAHVQAMGSSAFITSIARYSWSYRQNSINFLFALRASFLKEEKNLLTKGNRYWYPRCFLRPLLGNNKQNRCRVLLRSPWWTWMLGSPNWNFLRILRKEKKRIFMHGVKVKALRLRCSAFVLSTRKMSWAKWGTFRVNRCLDSSQRSASS